MKGSTILKKVLPIVIVLLLIIGVAVTVTAVKKSKGKVSEITGKDDVYLSLSETVDGKKYTYSITKNDIYTELFDSIGLSSAITMSNIDILKDKKNDEGVSIWDSVTEEEIKDAIKEACYGEDADLDKLSDDEKAEKEEDFLNTMYTGYGYDASNMYTNDIMNHYRLVLAKKAYAKYALNKAIKDAPSDDPYFSDDKVEDYYDDKYSSSFYGILVPFTSAANYTLALQQQRVVNSQFWKHATLKQNEETKAYSTETGEALTTFEVIETAIKLFNLLNPSEQLVAGTATFNEETKVYEVSEGADYAIVDYSANYADAKAAVDALEMVKTPDFDHDAATTLIATAQEKVEALTGGSTATLIEKLQKLADLVSGEATEGNPETVYDEIATAITQFAFKAYVFNLNNVDSPLYFDYTSLYKYDSNLPSKFSSNYANYVPFESLNNSSALWYTKSSLSSNSVYYVFVKLAELDSPKLSDVKEEIIEKLTEEELTDSFVEKKMAELREEYNFKFFNKDLDESYISSMSSYEVEHKLNKKKSNTALFKTDVKEYSADDLFAYMEKTAGLSTAVSDIAYQRLLNNPLFNKYKDMETGKWIGDEGKELKESITAQVENQRLYFLSGSYASYGYTPQTMTWEEFLYQLNGVKTEYELAEMILYSTISSDFIKKALDFAQLDGEKLDTKLKMNYVDSLNSEAWKLVEERMAEIIDDYFSCYGEHLLVSVYETVKDSVNGSNPIDPTDDSSDVKWTDEQKQLAKELLNEVQEYLLTASGTYSAKLDAVVKAFNAAPYAVKDGEEYIDVCDTDGNLYKYYLELGDIKIDLAKYKTAGLYLKHETLDSFGAGKMVEPFENAAKEIWAADMEKGLNDNITIYKNSEGDYNIETKFGYHLYVNLGSTSITTYDQVVVDADGTPTANTVKATLPSLYEVRTYLLHQAYEALDTTDYSDEDKARLEAIEEDFHEVLTTEVTNAITTYYSVVASEITGTYFSAILQQKEVKGLLGGATFNSNQFTTDDISAYLAQSFKNVYKANLKYLKNGDEEKFDITQAFSK